MSTAGRVGLDGAAGQGQARYNNDMGRAHEYMVTGKKVKNKPDAPNAVIGLFHQLPEELTNSLIVTGQVDEMQMLLKETSPRDCANKKRNLSRKKN